MKGIKWFFAEFFVVVAGVLVAFILNGWWMSIKEAEKEKTYIVQILGDVQTSIDRITEAEEEQRKLYHAASQLLATVYSNDNTDGDKLSGMLIKSLSFSLGSGNSATLSSLINSGDLQLISSDSLRVALISLSSTLDDYESSLRILGFQWLVPAYERIADDVNIADMRYEIFNDAQLLMASKDSLSGIPAIEKLNRPAKTNWPVLMESRSFRNNILKFQIAQGNLWKYHKNILEELQKAKQKIQEELDLMENGN